MDKALKQRLVGASVLIALAVIVLPMLLGGRQDGNSTEPRKIELPQQPPELSFETRRYPIGETAEDSQRQEPAVDDGQPTQLPAPRIPATTDLSTVQEDSGKTTDPTISGVDAPDGVAGGEESEGGDTTVPSADQHAVESLPAAGTEPDSATTSPGRYIVQVASFGGLDNANRLSARLKESGYTVMTDSVKSEVGTLHRVRVGPFSTETEAREVVNALGSSIKGVKPRVMDLQPEQTAQGHYTRGSAGSVGCAGRQLFQCGQRRKPGRITSFAGDERLPGDYWFIRFRNLPCTHRAFPGA